MKLCHAVLLLLSMGFSSMAADASFQSWTPAVIEKIPYFGHRNWIVIADSAYPAQSSPGIETIVTDANQVDVVRFILGRIGASRHVRAIPHLDQELQYLNDNEAPGVSGYRQQLADAFGGQSVSRIPHEQIISQLDQVSQKFHVLIIKTNMTIPYTSVFLQLDCAYWNADQEARFRAAMKSKTK